jgi:hypothetical protein
MNHKLVVEEDFAMEDVLLTLITMFDPKSAHKASNHMMKDIQGC